MSGTHAAPALELILRGSVIAVVRAEVITDPVALCRALVAGGITSIEFTFTTAHVEDYVHAASSALDGEVSIGVGTVLTVEQSARAVDAGAAFLVTPCPLPEIAAAARVPVLMGAMTPGEVLTAHNAGSAAVKVFPAGVLGARYLADLHGPFPHIPLVPSGGITESNAADYIAHGAAAVTAGTSVVSPALIASGDWFEITRRATAFCAALKGAD